MLPKRTRLRSFDYRGLYRYFLTICTYQRHEAFTDAEIVDAAFAHILRAAREHEFVIHAYAFMPDHLHLLVEGTSETSDLRDFVKLAKQYSGYDYSQSRKGRLWQPSYFDHVLREEESTPRVIAYIMNNPLRGGYANAFGEYRFVGSDTTSMEGIAEMLSGDSQPAWEP